MAENTEVIVVGGGYAGVMATNRLIQGDDVNVTLINPRPVFVERIRLHQLVAGTHDAVSDFRKILVEDVRLVVGTATWIDSSKQRVHLVNGDPLPYDYLVYAVGSDSSVPRVPGARDWAYQLGSFEEAEQLREVIDATPPTAPVTIVGAGPTGIEAAAELAEIGHSVTVVCGRELGPYLHPRGRTALRSHLNSLGVRVIEGPGTQVTEVTHDAVQLDDGRQLPSRVTVWTTGFSVPDLASRSGLSTDTAGRVVTDGTLTSIDDNRIVAAGDAAALADSALRMSCQAALPLGAQAARTVLSRLAEKPPQPCSVGFVGQSLSLGRRTGLIQFARRDDSVTRWVLGGRPAARVKELVCRLTVTRLVAEAHRPGPTPMLAAALRAVRGFNPEENLPRSAAREMDTLGR